jgi:hypothetical protein
VVDLGVRLRSLYLGEGPEPLRTAKGGIGLLGLSPLLLGLPFAAERQHRDVELGDEAGVRGALEGCEELGDVLGAELPSELSRVTAGNGSRLAVAAITESITDSGADSSALGNSAVASRLKSTIGASAISARIHRSFPAARRARNAPPLKPAATRREGSTSGRRRAASTYGVMNGSIVCQVTREYDGLAARNPRELGGSATNVFHPRRAAASPIHTHASSATVSPPRKSRIVGAGATESRALMK